MPSPLNENDKTHCSAMGFYILEEIIPRPSVSKSPVLMVSIYFLIHPK